MLDVAQRVEPGAADEEIVGPAEAQGHAAGVEGGRVVGVPGERFGGQRKRLADGAGKQPLLFRRWLHFRPPQEGVAAGDQLGFQGAGAEHHLEKHRLGEVVVAVRVARGGGDGLLKQRDGLRVFEVVEMIEALGNERVFILRQSQRRQQENRHAAASRRRIAQRACSRTASSSSEARRRSAGR